MVGDKPHYKSNVLFSAEKDRDNVEFYQSDILISATVHRFSRTNQVKNKFNRIMIDRVDRDCLRKRSLKR